MKLISLPSLLASLSFVSAAEIVLDWSIGWVKNVNPDGKFPRRAVGVNGQWPLPQVNAILGDIIIIHVKNTLTLPTSIHTHGLFQNKTFYQDGAPFVTECGIAPGSKYTYRIVASQSGSFWFHGHSSGQYVDGFRTPLIISDPTDLKKPYIEEIVLAVADWYHQEHAPLLKQYLSPNNPDGLEPVPDSLILQNGPKQIFFMPGKTYKIRLISMAAFASFHFWIDNHDFTIVEVDGIDVNPFKSSGIPVAAAQRYSILVTAKTRADKNYQVHFQIDQSMLPSNCPNPTLDIPIIYNPHPSFVPSSPVPSSLMVFDQSLIEPLQSMPIATPTLRLIYNVTFELYENENKQHINRGAFNRNPYRKPKVPSGLSVFTNSPNIRDPKFYGFSTSPQILNKMDVVQLVINNFDSGSHPFQ